MLGAFAVGEPPAGAEARILHAASRWRARRRAAFWGAGIAAAAVIGVCAALWTAVSSAPSGAQPVSPIAPAATSAEDLGTLKAELAEIREMCEVIPPEKQAERQAIDAKLSECLERLAYIEQRLGRVRENSSILLPERAVVHV
ncbi:MAG TPA: hypothetical protein DCM87_15150 [Planctomycetes bacterium]|nr:hypothetical protein [Planctomycetota bacterium]